jgi:hypothetical protein
MLAAIHLSNIPLERVFLVTGLSSIDWLVQTRKRIPIKNIFHRNTLDKFFHAVKKVNDPLILIDECHIASKPGQIIHKVTSTVQAKFVLVSATPDWKRFKPLPLGTAIRVMNDPPGYVSVQHFADSQHLHIVCIPRHPDTNTKKTRTISVIYSQQTNDYSKKVYHKPMHHNVFFNTEIRDIYPYASPEGGKRLPPREDDSRQQKGTLGAAMRLHALSQALPKITGQPETPKQQKTAENESKTTPTPITPCPHVMSLSTPLTHAPYAGN